jgi:hypothetical protein
MRVRWALLAASSSITLALISILPIGAGAIESVYGATARNSIIGVALSPAHFGHFSDHDFQVFFDEAAQIGSHVTWIFQWGSLPPSGSFVVMQSMAQQRGLKFQLWLSPTTLSNDRKDPDLPRKLAGKGFDDAQVRRAYVDEVIDLAALRPDVLGLATEVNLLAANPSEFASFVTLAHEAYVAVKKKYPDQIVTLSFQWEVMLAHQQFGMLKQFAGSVDVYSFTSYPDAFGDPSKVVVPDDYYSSISKYLPAERIAIAEIGWSSAPPGSEENQAAFFARLPDLTRGAKFEFVTLALLHDVSLFTGGLGRLNHVGIRTIDDAPKKSWGVIISFSELH